MEIVKVYGFPMNEAWMVEESMRLGFANPPEKYNINGQDLDAIEDVFDLLVAKSGIQGLRMNCVWVGDGLSILFWHLPYRQWKAPRTPEAERRLEALRETAHLPSVKPGMYASTDGDLPKILRRVEQPPPWIQKMRMESSSVYRPPPNYHAIPDEDGTDDVGNINP